MKNHGYVAQRGSSAWTIWAGFDAPVRARYDIVGRVVTYLGILAIVIVFSLFAALILSTALQRGITAP